MLCGARRAVLSQRSSGARRVGRLRGNATDYTPIALAIGAVVFVASAAWAARSVPARWKAATALQAAAALLAGGMVDDLWYDQRMVRGSACVRMDFCTWCQTRWWESPLIAFTLLAIVGALLALPIGALARRPLGQAST